MLSGARTLQKLVISRFPFFLSSFSLKSENGFVGHRDGRFYSILRAAVEMCHFDLLFIPQKTVLRQL